MLHHLIKLRVYNIVQYRKCLENGLLLFIIHVYQYRKNGGLGPFLKLMQKYNLTLSRLTEDRNYLNNVKIKFNKKNLIINIVKQDSTTTN